MERLTKRIKTLETIGIKYIPKHDNKNFEILNKLGEYEDAEEQGLLLRLPVAIGSEVWKIINQRDNFTDIHYKIVTIVNFRLDMLKEIGKTVFLTKEEAEQTLKKMEKNNNE